MVNVTIMQKNNGYQYNKYEYLLWFFLAVTFVLITSPFEAPIWGDEAYLLYMSQVIFRGEGVYNTTTFGYTPLCPLIAGYTMQIIDLVFGEVDTIFVSRVLGIILYGFIITSFFKLVKKIYDNRLISYLVTVFFLGISFLHLLSSTNFDPKMLALLFQLAGIYSLIKNKYLSGGVFLALSAMCWQPMVINCFAVTVFIFTGNSKIGKKFSLLIQLTMGVAIGTLPVVGYISLTNQWQAFWNQAVIRKVGVEGSELFDEPFRWLYKGIYSNFINESILLVLGGLGFLLIVILGFKGILTSTFNERTPYIRLLIIITLFWSLFNSMEFQDAIDLIPMIPIILIWSGFLLLYYSKKINFLNERWLLIPVTIYSLTNALSYSSYETFSQQKQFIKSIVDSKSIVLPFTFEVFFVINEVPMPTKVMRFASYEDYIINLIYPNGCSDVIESLQKTNELDVIITNRDNFGECGQMIIDQIAKTITFKSHFINSGRVHFLLDQSRIKEFRVYQITK